MELFCGNSQRIKAVGCFRRKAPSWMLDRILNVARPNNYLPLRQILAASTECLAVFLECLRIFCRMFDYKPGSIWRHSPEYLKTFPEMFGVIPQNVCWHSLEYNAPPIPHNHHIPYILFPVPVFLVLYTANFYDK